MIGALAGDIIGSVYEWNNIKTKEFPLFREDCFFTDDSILTVALADTILTGTPYAENLKKFARLYPGGGYGTSFTVWVGSGGDRPYQSWGNGAAMRISPAGWAYRDLETVLEKSKEFTAVTHDHPEGIKGGQATAAAVFLARRGEPKAAIREYVEKEFGYDLSRPLDEIRPDYAFDESCRGTVPPALRAFLEAEDFEDAIRNAVSLGGDTDTLACITGAVAEAFFGGTGKAIEEKVYSFLDGRLAGITREFTARYCSGRGPDGG